MRDICMHILDLAQNCVDAKSKNVIIILEENTAKNLMRLTIKDDGCGIPKEILDNITNPFTTTRTTRKVGMGTSLMDMVCKQSGGEFTIESEVNVGTKVVAQMQLQHLDRPPLGDIVGTLKLMVMTYAEHVNLDFTYKINDKEFQFSTNEIREALGENLSFSQPEVLAWLNDFLKENIKDLKEEEQ